MIYNSISPVHSDLCRLLYLVDLRSVYPAVADILSSNTPPIRFKESLPLAISDQQGQHKNWAPFTNPRGEIFIHVDLIPQTIYKLNYPDSSDSLPTFSSQASDLSILESVVSHTDEQNCVALALKPVVKAEIHQSSPFVEVIRCTSADAQSGSCDSNNPDNRIYVGVIQARHRPSMFYETRVLTLNSSFPFNYLSISKPLNYSTTPSPLPNCPFADTGVQIVGTDPRQLIYTVSLNFRKTHTQSSAELASGYLDDFLVLSFGIGDESSHFLEVRVDEVLKDHDMCKDLMSEEASAIVLG